jgi:hypothetical protein
MAAAPSISGSGRTGRGDGSGDLPAPFRTVCRAVPRNIFRVAEYGAHGAPGVVDATGAVTKALAAAAAAGGGTVYFERGQYWLKGMFTVPYNTYLQGAGMSLVSIYWDEQSKAAAAPYFFGGSPGHVVGNATAAGVGAGTYGSAGGAAERLQVCTWGLSDLTIYATSYYKALLLDCDAPWKPGAAGDRTNIRSDGYVLGGRDCLRHLPSLGS